MAVFIFFMTFYVVMYSVINTSEADGSVDLLLNKIGYPEHGTCNVVSDVVFVFDESKSLGSSDFDLMKTFMKDMVDRFNPVGYCATQFAALCFGLKTEGHFYLNAADNALGYKALIDGFSTKVSFGTRTDKALREVDKKYFLKRNGGKRLCSKEIVILLTDGEIFPNFAEALAKQAAHDLQDEGVTIFGIAVGDNVDLDELKSVSSPGLVYEIPDSASISAAIDKVVDFICSKPKCKSLCGRQKKTYYGSSSSSHDDDSDCYDDDDTLNHSYGGSSSDSSYSKGNTVINIGVPGIGNHGGNPMYKLFKPSFPDLPPPWTGNKKPYSQQPGAGPPPNGPPPKGLPPFGPPPKDLPPFVPQPSAPKPPSVPKPPGPPFAPKPKDPQSYGLLPTDPEPIVPQPTNPLVE